ncbi:hypothetical protein J6590_032883, partial [Homalodisca vitripennis]
MSGDVGTGSHGFNYDWPLLGGDPARDHPPVTDSTTGHRGGDGRPRDDRLPTGGGSPRA